MAALSARGLTAVVAASAFAGATATASASVPLALRAGIRRQLADGFASASTAIHHLAATVTGGTSMTGKWLGAALVAAVLFTAAGGAWHASSQQQPNAATPARGEKPVAKERRDDALPPGALFRFGAADRDRMRTASALSPDGHFVAVGDARIRRWENLGDASGRLDLWDARTGKLLRTLRADGPAVLKLAFSPDGRSLIECRSDNTVQFWSVLDGTKQSTHNYGITAFGLVFSPDGQDVLYGGHLPISGLRLCDRATGKVRWQNRKFFEGGTFSADGKTVLVVECQFLYFLDAASGAVQKEVKLSGPSNNSICCAVALAPDGRRLALGMQTGQVYFCDARTGDEYQRFHAADRPAKDAPDRGYFPIDGVREGFVNRVAFSPDGKWLGTGGSEGDVRLWEVATAREVLRLKGHKGWVVDLAFGSDGRTLLTSSEDGQAYLWSLRPPSEKPERRSLDTLWAALASEPAEAYRALWRLSETEGAAAFLRRKIGPAQPDARLAKWIADLDDDKFKVREKAHQALAGQGAAALPALRQSLAGKPSAELRRRIEALVQFAETKPVQAERLTAEDLREGRAITVLEMLGTEEARRALESLAGGAPGALRTTAARDALRRVGR
jgi:hypothetical protein